jgi:hypothetical protein
MGEEGGGGTVERYLWSEPAGGREAKSGGGESRVRVGARGRVLICSSVGWARATYGVVERSWAKVNGLQA